MAQAGYTPISLYYSTVTGSAPTAGQVVNGELGLNITDGKLYYKDNTGTIKVLAGAGGAGIAGGSNTQVQYNSSGSLAGSANMTFDGTSLSLTNQLNLTNASNYNLNASGAGANYMAGRLGVGTLPLTNYGIRNAINPTGAVTAYGYTFEGVVQSDVTTTAIGFLSNQQTAAASFTLTNLRSFDSASATIGSGSVVTNQTSFYSRALTGANNNFSFYGGTAAATGAWNLYMAGTADNYLAGALGIGSTSLTGFSLRLGKTVTGATTSYAIHNGGTIQPDVTSGGIYYQSFASTAANGGTPYSTAVYHYQASQGTFNADSTVTTQYGFAVASSMTGGTSNFGFYGNLASGTGRYNLYMIGTAANYLAGSLGIGSTALTDRNLGIGKNITGAVTSYGILQNSAIQSDVTSNAYINHTNITTAAAAFTLTGLSHYSAGQSTIGAGSTVTNQYGFIANSTLTGATNNFGFYGNIGSGSNRWNLYMAGTADNYLAGTLNIGVAAPTAGFNLNIQKTLTGATSAYNVYSNPAIQSDVTTIASAYIGTSSTQATAFTIASVRCFDAAPMTIGAGSSVTAQIGYLARAGFTGATNNQAFTGNLAAATGTYNLYMAGTADNYLAGSLGIGSTSLTGINLYVSKNITGATTSYAVAAGGTVQSDVTSIAYGYQSFLGTQATAFTLPSLVHFGAVQTTVGAGSTVTSQFAFNAGSFLTTATNNYGFRGAIAAATGRYNLYMDGTAANYLAGNTGIGTTTTTAAQLTVAGSSSIAALKVPNMKEVITVSATAATGTINYDTTTQSVLYYTTNASGNFTINFRGSSGTTMDTLMSTGESMSFTFLNTNGATAYYNSAVQVDGTTVGVTTKWQGGTAPTSGNASSIDSYTYVVIKTGSATFTVLATQTKFA